MDMRGTLLSVAVGAIFLTCLAGPTAIAGGPVCPPPLCPPAMCAPPPCPPPSCGPHPLAAILSGALRVVTGVIALPFRVVDSVIDHLRCGPRCCPPPVAMCPPMPCPPPMCGPAGCPLPAIGYGMMPPRPVGLGRGAPRRFAPMAKETVLPMMLYATPMEGFFGTYW